MDALLRKLVVKRKNDLLYVCFCLICNHIDKYANRIVKNIVAFASLRPFLVTLQIFTKYVKYITIFEKNL